MKKRYLLVIIYLGLIIGSIYSISVYLSLNSMLVKKKNDIKDLKKDNPNFIGSKEHMDMEDRVESLRSRKNLPSFIISLVFLVINMIGGIILVIKDL